MPDCDDCKVREWSCDEKSSDWQIVDYQKVQVYVDKEISWFLGVGFEDSADLQGFACVVGI